MADIKQAARWMENERQVKRASSVSSAIFRCSSRSIEYRYDPAKFEGDERDEIEEDWEDAVFTVDDILADDWEIVVESQP